MLCELVCLFAIPFDARITWRQKPVQLSIRVVHETVNRVKLVSWGGLSKDEFLNLVSFALYSAARRGQEAMNAEWSPKMWRDLQNIGYAVSWKSVKEWLNGKLHVEADFLKNYLVPLLLKIQARYGVLGALEYRPVLMRLLEEIKDTPLSLLKTELRAADVRAQETNSLAAFARAKKYRSN